MGRELIEVVEASLDEAHCVREIDVRDTEATVQADPLLCGELLAWLALISDLSGEIEVVGVDPHQDVVEIRVVAPPSAP